MLRPKDHCSYTGEDWKSQSLADTISSAVAVNHVSTEKLNLTYELLRGTQPPESYTSNRLKRAKTTLRKEGMAFVEAWSPLVCAAVNVNTGKLDFFVVDKHHTARVFGDYRKKLAREQHISPNEIKIPCRVFLLDQVAPYLGIPVQALVQQLEDDSAIAQGEFSKRIPNKNMSIQSIPLAVLSGEDRLDPDTMAYNVDSQTTFWYNVAAQYIQTTFA